MRSLILIAVFLSALTSFCGSSRHALKGGKPPDWVYKGSGYFEIDGVKAFYGIGNVSGIKNKALSRDTAENRARAKIQQLFETYSATLMRDYQAGTTAGDFEATAEEQHVEEAIKTFSAGTLSGVEIIDHWESDEGTFYALARLNLDHFKGVVQKMKELNAQIRDFVRQNAEKTFQKLEKEEEKRGL